MGELIIHIDQESGAVLKVLQKLDEAQKKTLSSDPKGYPADEITSGIIELQPAGSLYHQPPSKILDLKEHRDKFQRIVPFPVELWEIKGNTICTINLGGVIYQCVH